MVTSERPTPRGESRSTARLAAIALGLALPAAAAGSAWDVEARTEAQFYAVPRLGSVPGQIQWLRRQRLVQVLDLAGFELVAGEDAGLSLLLRLDSDFGLSRGEDLGLDDAYRSRMQLLGGHLHWKGLARGRLDVEAGRIAALDPVSFLAFDGGRLTARPLRWLALTAFGGLRVEGASWMGSPAFAPDGVRDRDARRLAAFPAVACPPLPPLGPGQPDRPCADATLDDPAPTFGGRIAVTALPGGFSSGAHVEYRRTLRAGGVVEELLGAGLRYQSGPVAADAAAQWDLYWARLAALRAALRWAALPWLGVAAEGSRSVPVFSADSIFGSFDVAPWQEARLRLDLSPPQSPLRAWVAGGLGRVEPTAFGRAAFGDRGATAPEAAGGATLTSRVAAFSADASWRGGAQGRQTQIAARARRTVRGWLGLDLRASLASVQDPLVRAYSGTFLSAAAQVSGRLERRARLALLAEVSQGRFGRGDVRVQALLDLGVDWDSRLR